MPGSYSYSEPLSSDLSNVNARGKKIIQTVSSESIVDSVTGKIKPSLLPSIALTSITTVANAAARLALNVQSGDGAKQTDDLSFWIYDGAAWIQIDSPTSFDNLTDTTFSGLVIGDTARWDGVKWINDTSLTTHLNDASIHYQQPLTTKGDLWTRNAGGSIRLPVGLSDGLALTVSAVADSGLAWAAPAGMGEVNTSSSAGGSESLVLAKSGQDLPFKGLSAGSNVTLTPGANDITIEAINLGEVNTTSSAGGTESLVLAKSGQDLPFKGLSAGSNVTLTPGANDITIEAADGYDPNQADVLLGLNSGGVGGLNQICIGESAGALSSGNFRTAIGYAAGEGSGLQTVTAGYVSGKNCGNYSVSIGSNTCENSGINCVGIGRRSCNLNAGDRVIGIGLDSCQTGAGTDSIGIGRDANRTNAPANSISLNATGVELTATGISQCHIKPVRNDVGNGNVLGYDAATGEVSYRTEVVASGESNTSSSAGGTESLVLPKSGLNLPFKGLTAGSNITLTPGANDVTITGSGGFDPNTTAIKIGSLAGENNVSSNLIAIGGSAARQPSGDLNVAIGNQAFESCPGALFCCAVGIRAAKSNSSNSVLCFGTGAGEFSCGEGALCLGNNAGNSAAGASSINIGSGSKAQGAGGVSIGGGSSSIYPGTIIICANVSTQAGQANSFYVNPIRQVNSVSDILFYNPSTKEITHEAISLHSHANGVNLDSINQSMASTDPVTFQSYKMLDLGAGDVAQTYLTGGNDTVIQTLNTKNLEIRNGASIDLTHQFTSGGDLNIKNGLSIGGGSISTTTGDSLRIVSGVLEMEGSAQNSSVSSTWNFTSDQRLKKNITTYNSSQSCMNLMAVRVVNYNFRHESDDSPKRIGVVANELEKIYPCCVKEKQTHKYIDHKTKQEVSIQNVKTINTDNLFWNMLASIQELTKKLSCMQNQQGGTNDTSVLKLDIQALQLENQSLTLQNENLTSRVEAMEAMLFE